MEIFPDVGSAAASGPFDCITLWHSLEHLPDPRVTLHACRMCLGPQGCLFVAVPDAGGLQARVFGAHWFHLDVPRHLHHFTDRSLARLLRACGFATVRAWNQEFEFDLLGWSQSALNALGLPKNLFFLALTGRAAGARKLPLALSWICGTAFSALALPLLGLATPIGRGGTLIVAARLG
jgi:hypothetical protein